MTLDDKLFNEYMHSWGCYFTSYLIKTEPEGLRPDPEEYLRHDAYKLLLTLGKEILPYIKRRMATYCGNFDKNKDTDGVPSFAYTSLVEGIMGAKFRIPHDVVITQRDLHVYTYGWLSGYLSRGK